jgi:AraC family ethanolamine operon transcriptional activator
MIPIAGGRAFSNGQEIGREHVLVAPPGGTFDFTAPSHFEYLIGAFDEESFLMQFRNQWGIGPFVGTSSRRFRVTSQDEKQLLVGRWEQVLENAKRDPSILRQRRSASSLEDLLLTSLFETLTYPGESRPDAGRTQLAREVERFLRRNLTEELTLNDVLVRFGTPARTLHQGFREAFGVTPKSYLRALRLSAARRELLKGRDRSSVSQVALTWGFFHFGRFSEQYKQMFGESPASTLRAASGRPFMVR